MKRKEYVNPEVGVYELEMKNSMLISTSDTPADPEIGVYSLEHEENSKDIWN